MVDDWIQALCDSSPKLIFMNKKAICLDGILIVGTTLWSYIPSGQASQQVEYDLQDYERIFVESRGGGFQAILSKHTNSWFKSEVQWLHEILFEAKLPVIVLTHHAPSMHGTQNSNQALSNAQQPYNIHGFCSELDHLLAGCEYLTAWFYGHTHWNNVQKRKKANGLGHVLLASNQYGFPTQAVSDYKDDFVINTDDLVCKF